VTRVKFSGVKELDFTGILKHEEDGVSHEVKGVNLTLRVIKAV
jgi:hypothetical protein